MGNLEYSIIVFALGEMGVTEYFACYNDTEGLRWLIQNNLDPLPELYTRIDQRLCAFATESIISGMRIVNIYPLGPRQNAYLPCEVRNPTLTQD